MVEVKHTSRYSANGNNVVLAHQVQQVYYLSYPHSKLKNWWVVFNVNPEVHPHRYDEYIENNEDDVDVYQEEMEEENFTVSLGTDLTELATDTLELMPEEPAGTSKKRVQQSQRIIEKRQRINEEYERLDEEILDQESEEQESEEHERLEQERLEQERLEQLHARVAEADSDADDF